MFIASSIVILAAIYAALGIVFAVLFAIRGAAVIDPGAEKAHWAFRFLIIPGAAALWPILLRRWLRVVRAARADGRGHA